MAAQSEAPYTPAEDKQKEQHGKDTWPAADLTRRLRSISADVLRERRYGFRGAGRRLHLSDTTLEALKPGRGVKMQRFKVAPNDALAKHSAWKTGELACFQFTQVTLRALGRLTDGCQRDTLPLTFPS